MTLKNIPSTSPNKLSAERVYRVALALAKRLQQKGVLTLPPETTPARPEALKPSRGEEPQRTITLDCRPPSKYRVLRVIESGKSETNPTAAPGGKPE